MASKVTIANLALGWLGQTRLTAITDPGVSGQLIRDNFDDARDAVLEDHAWVFANARRRLSPDPIPPEFGFEQRFKIPADLIRILEVNETDRSDNATSWAREGDYILANVELIYVKYTRRVVEISRMSPNFIQAFAQRLAADLALPITESRTMQEHQWAAYLSKLDGAAATDGMQGTNQRIRSNRMLRSRDGFFPGSNPFGNIGGGAV